MSELGDYAAAVAYFKVDDYAWMDDWASRYGLTRRLGAVYETNK